MHRASASMCRTCRPIFAERQVLHLLVFFLGASAGVTQEEGIRLYASLLDTWLCFSTFWCLSSFLS